MPLVRLPFGVRIGDLLILVVIRVLLVPTAPARLSLSMAVGEFDVRLDGITLYGLMMMINLGRLIVVNFAFGYLW